MPEMWRIEKINKAILEGEIPDACFLLACGMVNYLEMGDSLLEATEELEALYGGVYPEKERDLLLDQVDIANVWVRTHSEELDLLLDQSKQI